MSKLQKLMEELCPEGVEFKPLESVIERNIGGGTPSKSKAEYWDGDIPWASVGDLSISNICIEQTRNLITNQGLENSTTNIVPAGSVIVALKIAPGKMKVNSINVAINQDIRGLVLKQELCSKFLAYYFETISINGHGTIVKSINTKQLNKILVPVPPLEVQNEIVRILDSFTLLEAELEAELEARRKQYAHYREKLLNFDDLSSLSLSLQIERYRSDSNRFKKYKSSCRKRSFPILRAFANTTHYKFI